MTQRIVLTEKEDEDGETEADAWMDINHRAESEVSRIAMENNLRYGEALAQFVSNCVNGE